MDESKLVFFTGAPGSKWSAVAHIMAQSKKYLFDTGDYAEDRQYAHYNDPDIIPHRGSYFGPGFPFGDSFDALNRLSKKEIFEEIERAWITTNNGYKIIKCHQFSIDLPKIYKMFPNSKFVIVYRSDEKCEEGWFGAGGFDIPYPRYKEGYTNKETMIKAMAHENRHNLMFIHENKLTMNVCNEGYWKNVFDVDTDDSIIKKYIRMVEGVPLTLDSKKLELKNEDGYSMMARNQKLDTFIATMGFE